MLTQRKRIAFTVALVVVAVLIIALCAEGILRIYHIAKHKRRYIYLPDHYLGYVLARNNSFKWWGDDNHPEFLTSHKTNSLGLLEEKLRLGRAYDVARIVVMGDSFTEALQVEPNEGFSFLLEENLREYGRNRKLDIEVIKGGVRGYSPLVHYLHYKRDLSALNPNIVLLQLFANDIFEDHHAKKRSVLDGRGLPLTVSHYFKEKGSKKTALLDNAKIYALH